MPLDYRRVSDLGIQDDTHNLVMESAPSPKWEWTPSGHTPSSVDSVGSDAIDTFKASFAEANILTALYNWYNKPGEMDLTMTQDRVMGYLKVAEETFGQLSPNQKDEFVNNVTSEKDFEWQMSVLDDHFKVQKLIEGSPIAGGIGTFAGAVVDPTIVVGGAGTAKAVGAGARFLKMGHNTFGIPAGAVVGALGGYGRESIESKYKAIEDPSYLTSAVLGAGIGAVAGSTGVLSSLKAKYSSPDTVTGLPLAKQKGLAKIFPSIARRQSMFDTIASFDRDTARVLLGGASEGLGGTGVTAHALTYQMELYPALNKFEQSLTKIDKMFPQSIWDRISPWRADARATREALVESAQRDALAYLMDTNEFEKYIGALKQAHKELQKNLALLGKQDIYTGAKVFGQGDEAIEATLAGRGSSSFDVSVASLRRGILDINKELAKVQTSSNVVQFKSIDLPEYLDVARTRPVLPENPMAREIIKAYQDSNIGSTLGKLINERSTLDKVHISNNYAHLAWDADKLEQSIHTKLDAQRIAMAFGRQILSKIKPTKMADEDLSSRMGALFLSGVISNHKGNAILASFIQDVIKKEDEELVELLYKFSGESLPESLTFTKLLESVMGIGKMPNMGAIGQSSLFQHRFPWELSAVSDYGVKLKDFIRTDLYANTERTVMETARRVALSNVEFKDPITGDVIFLNNGKNLEIFFRDLRDKCAKAHGTEEADRVVDMLRSMLLGQPYGEQLSTNLRTFANIAQAIHLGKSGMYNFAEYGSLMAEYGAVNTMKAFVPALKRIAGRDLKNLTPEDGKDLADCVSDYLAFEGRMKPRVNIQQEDYFDAPSTLVGETVEYYTQGVRFLNGSEYIRRHQIQMASSMYSTVLKRASRGIEKDLEYLKKQGIPENILKRILTQTKKYGTAIGKWKDKEAVHNVLNYCRASVDDTVLTIRAGERPLIMETALGKVIFAYQSFVFASHNKLLRRKFNQGGFASVAYLMASQLPLAVLAGVASNIMDGKPPTKDLGSAVSNSMSSLGIFGMATNAIVRGELGGTFPGLAPVTNALQLPTKIADGDPLALLKLMPWLAVVAPLRMAVGAYPSLTGEQYNE